MSSPTRHVAEFSAEEDRLYKKSKISIKNMSQMDDWMILPKTPSKEKNLENLPHALLIGRRPEIALTSVVDFGSTLASAPIGMRSNHVTQSKGAVVISRDPKARLCQSHLYVSQYSSSNQL